NPELTLLVQTTVECHSGSVFLLKYDPNSEDDKYVQLESFDYERNELNKNLLAEFPKLERELAQNKFINWKHFCFANSHLQEILHNHEKYQDMMLLVSQEDIDFDQMEPIDD
ncbi:MAG: hypothetical protein AB7I18_14800, partial [Candidatus Berkiella sp.]